MSMKTRNSCFTNSDLLFYLKFKNSFLINFLLDYRRSERKAEIHLFYKGKKLTNIFWTWSIIPHHEFILRFYRMCFFLFFAPVSSSNPAGTLKTFLIEPKLNMHKNTGENTLKIHDVVSSTRSNIFRFRMT